MLFRDLEVGATFKFKKEGITNEGETRVKVYPIGFGKSLGYIDTRLQHVHTFASLGEQEVLTLQKVTKTEKKWVAQNFDGLPRNTVFRFKPDGEDHIRCAYQSCYNSTASEGFYYNPKTNLFTCFFSKEKKVYVEKETTIETEEWLP